MEKIGVLHLIDSLNVGGAEKMAVNLANQLSRSGFRTFLCATRREGPLKTEIQPGVGYLYLNRKAMFDVFALLRLMSFIRVNKIQIIHAHSTSLGIGAVAGWLCNVSLVWHDHFGHGHIVRKPILYRFALMKCRTVISVSSQLAEWAREQVGVQNVFYIPNFAKLGCDSGEVVNLPGIFETRIACVANLLPVKDHETLLKAMSIVVRRDVNAHLLLVGSTEDEEYTARIQVMIAQLSLRNRVTLLGLRRDVAAILKHCVIGVLSSRSEGLPVSLLEYGLAGLAVVATDVGQCGELIENEKTGLLIQPGDVDALANAVMRLLHDPDLQKRLAAAFNQRVNSQYSAASVVAQVEKVYRGILEGLPIQ